jgi:hypothetical protein
MANMPNNKPAYQGKRLSPTPDRQASQGRATAERSGRVNEKLLPRNPRELPK